MNIESLLSSSKYPKKVILEKLIINRLSLTKEDLFVQTEREINSEDLSWIQDGYHQYTIDKKPLEYILWYVEFAGIRYMVTPDTLIPRPETEYMIEAVNEYIQGDKQTELPPVKGVELGKSSEGGLSKYNVLDIGTWCWVLWLSVLYHNSPHITKILLSEVVPETLDVAKKNGQRLFSEDKATLSRISYLQSNLLDHPEISDILLSDDPTILVANLPYIPEWLFDNNTDEWIKKREPKMAFVWGDDGLDLYRIMFDQLLALGSSSHPTMFLEMMTRQCDILRQEYEGKFEFEEVKTFHFNIRILKTILK